MNKQEVISFLRQKRGYLKKSSEFLAKRLDISEELATECRKLVNAEEWVDYKAQRDLKNKNSSENIDLPNSSGFLRHLDENGLNLEDVKSVKFWQSASGEQRYSVVTMNQWHQMPSVKKELMEYIKQYSPKVPKIKYKKDKDPVLYEISLPDIHYGKETGEGPKALEKHYLTAITDLHRKADGLNIEKFLLPVGNDGMNSEGLSRATTKGTPQYDYMSWKRSFRGYWNLVCKAIDYLSQFAPVDVIVVQGNHDFERMFYAGEVLAAMYHNNKNVNVNNSLDIRKYYLYGVNMIMFTHGDKEKPHELPLLIATEKPDMWSKSKFREVHCGHKHKEMLNEYMGTKVRFIPAICGNDAWHKMQGYIGTLRVGQAFIWNKVKGLEGHLQTNVINYEKEKS